jgi:histidyl-tRNA synthetase
VSEALGRLGFNDFVIRLNDRRLLGALLEIAGVGHDKQDDALVAIDKLDKIGASGVAAELAARGIGTAAAAKLLTAFETPAETSLPTVATLLDKHASGAAAVGALDAIVRLAASTPAAPHIRVDPSLARGLSYYTGAIMEIAVPDLAGSLGGGGRYDNLIGMFLGREIPACGFSLGLERIIVVMTERGMFPESIVRTAVDVMVTLWSDESRNDGLALAAELRRCGLRVDVYPEADKLGKQVKYASSRSVPVVAIVGDDERARGAVALKDLRTGEQKSVPRAEAAQFVKNLLNG